MKNLCQNRLLMGAVLAVMLAGTSAASAEYWVHIEYSGLHLNYVGSTLTLQDLGSSAASASIVDSTNTAVPLDTAVILNNLIAPGKFDLELTATIVNGGGVDDVSMIGGTLKATDVLTTLAAPSIAAAAFNTAFGGDLDGITFDGTTLTIRGLLATLAGNDSILLNPAGALAWTYKGEGGTDPDLDGVADQITVPLQFRSNYDVGMFYQLNTLVTRFKDGTSTAGITNADELFAAAALHGGFEAGGGELKIDIIPAPAGVLLGVIGLCVVGWTRRRVA